MMLTYENSIQFVKGQEVPLTLRNFFAPEDGFIWSTSRWSEISFNFSATPMRGKRFADLIIEMDAFKADSGLEGQNVFMYLNGLRIGSHYITRRITLVIPLDATVLKTSDNVLTFDTPESNKPSAFGIPDDRYLGIQLFSMQIRSAG